MDMVLILRGGFMLSLCDVYQWGCQTVQAVDAGAE